MSARGAARVLALALACAVASGAPAATAAPARAAAALLVRLQQRGRAEVRIERRPTRDETIRRAWQGTLVLEPPDRARLDIAGSGERMTCRSDGGEWLQPALGQMLRLGPGRVAPLLDVWTLLIGGTAAARLQETALGARRYRLVPQRGAVDSAWVTLGLDGLPARLETQVGAERSDWRLRDWRFSRARGREAFVLRAPSGIAVIPWE